MNLLRLFLFSPLAFILATDSSSTTTESVLREECQNLLSILPDASKVSETLQTYKEPELKRLREILLSDKASSSVNQLIEGDFPTYKVLKKRLLKEAVKALEDRFANSVDSFTDKHALGSLKELLVNTDCSVTKLLYLKHYKTFAPKKDTKELKGDIATHLINLAQGASVDKLLESKNALVTARKLIEYEMEDLKKKQEAEFLKPKTPQNVNANQKPADTGDQVDFSIQQSDEDADETEDDTNSKRILWVLIALSSAAAIGVVIFFVYKRRSALQKVDF